MTRPSPHPAARHITPGHVRAFQAITSRLYDNITLWSCTVNGEPGVAIVMVDEPAEGQLAVMPLFVAITDGMAVEFEGSSRSRGAGGGPRKPGEAFRDAQQDATAPRPA